MQTYVKQTKTSREGLSSGVTEHFMLLQFSNIKARGIFSYIGTILCYNK